MIRNEPPVQLLNLRTCTPSEDSDQPVHSGSLTRVFTESILDTQECKVSSSGHAKLWSDSANAQTVLSLRWSNMSEGRFLYIPAQIMIWMIWTEEPVYFSLSDLRFDHILSYHITNNCEWSTTLITSLARDKGYPPTVLSHKAPQEFTTYK